MAVYKRDIADINLETGNIHRTFLNHSIGLKDQKADHFGVRVFRDGEPVNLSGVSVQGVFMPPQGSPIAITSGNIVSGNVAEVVLPQACYNYDGQFCLAIKLVDATNSVTGTVRIVDGMVDNTHASGTVAPTSAVPTYQEVLSVYEQAIAAISTVNAIAGKMAVDITAGAESTSNNSFRDLGNRWMTFRRGYYSTPSAGSTSSYTDDVNYVYALVACAPGDVLHAHGYGDGTSKSAWAFLDSSLKILDRGGSGNYEGATDPAPTSTAFALVNVKLASLGSGYYGWIGAEAIKDQIATLKDAVSEDGNIIYSRDLKSALKAETGNELLDGWSANHYYINTGSSTTGININSPTNTASNVRYMVVPCIAGDVFQVTCAGGSGSRAWAFIDDNGDIPATNGREAANTSCTDKVITAPTGCVYLIVNDTTLSGYVIKNKYLKTRVSDLETNALLKKGTLTNADDLNDVTTIGMYSISVTSLPANMPYNIGGLLVVTENGLISQVFYGRGAEYYRCKTSQGWTRWLNHSDVIATDRLLTSADDLDNITYNGIYSFARSSMPSNAPVTKGALMLVVNRDTLVEQQVYVEGTTYTRLKTSSGWADWDYSVYRFYGLLTDEDDLDNNIMTGIYYTNRLSGIPAHAPTNIGGIVLSFRATNNLVQQMYFTKYSKYYRFKSSSGWEAWTTQEQGSMEGIPKLNLSGDTTGMSKETAVSLDWEFLGQTGTCTLKWQGSSSLRYPKKNYTFKSSTAFDAWALRQAFVNAYRASIGDVSRVSTDSRWGNQKKYVAKANWIDASMMRNLVSARLWGEMVKGHVDAGDITDGRADAPNYGAVDGFPISVAINDVNQGLYTFNIPKDTWTFAMGSENTEYLVTGENNYSQACRWKALATFDEDQSGERTVDFDFEYVPDGVSEDTVKASFNTAIQAVIDAGSSWETSVAPYLDIDSVFDYYIFSCCICNEDGFARNTIYGTYDGTKWFLSAYDMDSTYGMNVYGSGIYDVVGDRSNFTSAASFNRLVYLMTTYSKARFKARYAELRSGILSERHVFEVMSRFAIDISDSNYSNDQKIWLKEPGTTMAKICQYMEYYRMHCKYLDDEVENM